MGNANGHFLLCKCETCQPWILRVQNCGRLLWQKMQGFCCKLCGVPQGDLNLLAHRGYDAVPQLQDLQPSGTTGLCLCFIPAPEEPLSGLVSH